MLGYPHSTTKLRQVVLPEGSRTRRKKQSKGEARLPILQHFTQFVEQAASGVPLDSLSKWAVLLARSHFYQISPNFTPLSRASS